MMWFSLPPHIFVFVIVGAMGPVLKDLHTPLRQVGEACGYESCPSIVPHVLNVHIVPHTHGELGYSRTFHQHYTGYDDIYDKNEINMKMILDNTISELWADRNRRFTLSDFPYFFHWWNNQDPSIHRKVYELIRQGRLYLVGGGWGMSDEATTNYQAIIDQYTYTLRKINSTFSECGRPLVAWQSEVFGHSREFASLMAQMGFDGLFINPISFDDELNRMNTKGMEFLWRGSDDLERLKEKYLNEERSAPDYRLHLFAKYKGGPISAETDIYTHKLFDGYWSPPGFCFGGLCDDPLLVTSDTVLSNIKERVDLFLQSARHRQAPYYNTNNIMIMMGQRFGYYDAGVWFANIDKLIDYVNAQSYKENSNVRLFYSTPSCYLKAVHEADPSLRTKQDDFLPYGYDKHSYATGFYTSRPSIKLMLREGNVFLQMAKQLQVTANLGNNDRIFEEFAWIMGAFQDHSVISGELREHVKDYYVHRMYNAVQRSTLVMKQAFNKLRGSSPDTMYYRCNFNISSCRNTNGPRVFVVIYNPLAWRVSVPVRLPVSKFDYVVYNPKGQEIKTGLMRLPNSILKLPFRNTTADHELVFIAENLPPLGYRSYLIEIRNVVTKRSKRELPTKYLNAASEKSYDAMNMNMKTDFKSVDDSSHTQIDVTNVNINNISQVIQATGDYTSNKSTNVKCTEFVTPNNKFNHTQTFNNFLEDTDENVPVLNTDDAYSKFYTEFTPKADANLQSIKKFGNNTLKIHKLIYDNQDYEMRKPAMFENRLKDDYEIILDHEFKSKVHNRPHFKIDNEYTSVEEDYGYNNKYDNNFFHDKNHSLDKILNYDIHIDISGKNYSKERKNELQYLDSSLNKLYIEKHRNALSSTLLPQTKKFLHHANFLPKNLRSTEKTNENYETFLNEFHRGRISNNNSNNYVFSNYKKDELLKNYKNREKSKPASKSYIRTIPTIRNNQYEESHLNPHIKFNDVDVIPSLSTMNTNNSQLNIFSSMTTAYERNFNINITKRNTSDSTDDINLNDIDTKSKNIEHLKSNLMYTRQKNTSINNVYEENFNSYVDYLPKYFIPVFDDTEVEKTKLVKPDLDLRDTVYSGHSFIDQNVIPKNYFGMNEKYTSNIRLFVTSNNSDDLISSYDFTSDSTIKFDSSTMPSIAIEKQPTQIVTDTIEDEDSDVVTIKIVFDDLTDNNVIDKTPENEIGIISSDMNLGITNSSKYISQEDDSNLLKKGVLVKSKTPTYLEVESFDDFKSSEYDNIKKNITQVETDRYHTIFPVVDTLLGVTTTSETQPYFNKDYVTTFMSDQAFDNNLFHLADLNKSTKHNSYKDILHLRRFQNEDTTKNISLNRKEIFYDDKYFNDKDSKEYEKNKKGIRETTTSKGNYINTCIKEKTLKTPLAKVTKYSNPYIDFLKNTAILHSAMKPTNSEKNIVTENIYSFATDFVSEINLIPETSTQSPDKEISPITEFSGLMNFETVEQGSNLLITTDNIFFINNNEDEKIIDFNIRNNETENKIQFIYSDQENSDKWWFKDDSFKTNDQKTVQAQEMDNSKQVSLDKYLSDIIVIDKDENLGRSRIKNYNSVETFSVNKPEFDIATAISFVQKTVNKYENITTLSNVKDHSNLMKTTSFRVNYMHDTSTPANLSKEITNEEYEKTIEFLHATRTTRRQNYLKATSINQTHDININDMINISRFKEGTTTEIDSKYVVSLNTPVRPINYFNKSIDVPSFLIFTQQTTDVNDASKNLPKNENISSRGINFTVIPRYNNSPNLKSQTTGNASDSSTSAIIVSSKNDKLEEENKITTFKIVTTQVADEVTFPNINITSFINESLNNFQKLYVTLSTFTKDEHISESGHQKLSHLGTETNIHAQTWISEIDEIQKNKNYYDYAVINGIRRMSSYAESQDQFIQNKYIKITIDAANGKISSLITSSGISIPFDIQFYYYESDEPLRLGRSNNKQPGAYIFRPLDEKHSSIRNFVETKIFKNDIVEEIHCDYSSYASLNVKLYKFSPVIEVDWVLGPVPIDDGLGKEVFIRYMTDLVHNGTFYTDANGRQTIKRIRDQKPTYLPVNPDKVAGNYYPVTSKISIEDKYRDVRLTIFTDRTQGGTSLSDGEIDLMIQRRILTDDSGIQATLNELEDGKGVIIRGTHNVLLSKPSVKINKILEKELAKEIELQPKVFSSVRNIYGDDTKKIWLESKNEFTGLKSKLPFGIHILTLEKLQSNLLLRIENYLEKSDFAIAERKVFLEELFTNIKIKNIKETTLAAHLWLNEWVPIQWRKTEKFMKNFNNYYGSYKKEDYLNDETLNPIEDVNLKDGISLMPQQIRTFILSYEYVY